MSYDTTILADPNLVHFWKLNETVGSGTAADSKGAQSGTINAGVTMGATALITDGETCASMAGASNADITYSNENVSRTAFSIEFIVKFTDLAADYGCIQLFDSDGGTYVWLLHGTARIEFGRVFSFGSSINTLASANSSIASGTVYYIVCTCTGTSASDTQKIYINGSQSGSTRTGAWNTSKSQAAISFAGGIDGFGVGTAVRLKGSIEKVALYNAALSSATISAHYAATTGGGGGVLTSSSTDGLHGRYQADMNGGMNSFRRIFDMGRFSLRNGILVP